MNSNSSAYFPIFALAKRTQPSKPLVELNSEAPQVIRNDNHQMEQGNIIVQNIITRQKKVPSTKQNPLQTNAQRRKMKGPYLQKIFKAKLI